jgi:hypothetical protein
LVNSAAKKRTDGTVMVGPRNRTFRQNSLAARVVLEILRPLVAHQIPIPRRNATSGSAVRWSRLRNAVAASRNATTAAPSIGAVYTVTCQPMQVHCCPIL